MKTFSLPTTDRFSGAEMAQKAKEKPELPPGVVFYPNDKELVFRYLKNKQHGRIDVETCFIREIELYKFKPSDLSDLAHDSGHKKMYFFTLLHKKFKQGPNFDRQVPGGFWKKTGKTTNVNDKYGNSVATKTSLTYYKKEPTEEKTEWLMTEYKLIESQPQNKNDEEPKMSATWAVCVVYQSTTVRKTKRGSNDN